MLGIAPCKRHMLCKLLSIACIADILLRKTRRKILSSPKGSDFSSQNKEENPLLAKGLGFFFEKQGVKSSAPAKAVAFCSAKQGGFIL